MAVESNRPLWSRLGRWAAELLLVPGRVCRLLAEWKIEGYLHSDQTYFVVAGAAHMGGPDGLLALLQARGYKIEQL